jgi:hypothetical protein
MMASVMLEAPLAGPAVISLGYLAARSRACTRASAAPLMDGRSVRQLRRLDAAFIHSSRGRHVGSRAGAVTLAPVFAARRPLLRRLAIRRPDMAPLERLPEAAGLGAIGSSQGRSSGRDEPQRLPVSAEPPLMAEMPGQQYAWRAATGPCSPCKPLRTPRRMCKKRWLCVAPYRAESAGQGHQAGLFGRFDDRRGLRPPDLPQRYFMP